MLSKGSSTIPSNPPSTHPGRVAPTYFSEVHTPRDRVFLDEAEWWMGPLHFFLSSKNPFFH
jgi:hypothetical protein